MGTFKDMHIPHLIVATVSFGYGAIQDLTQYITLSTTNIQLLQYTVLMLSPYPYTCTKQSHLNSRLYARQDAFNVTYMELIETYDKK